MGVYRCYAQDVEKLYTCELLTTGELFIQNLNLSVNLISNVGAGG